MKILFFALLLLSQVANAQLKVASSKPVNISNGFFPDRLHFLGNKDGRYYIYNGRTGAFTVYDDKMNIITESKLDIAEQGEYAAAFYLNEKMYVLISVKAEEKGKLVAYEVSADGKTKEVSALTAAISEIKTEAKPKFHLLKTAGKLAVVLSDDKSKIGLYYTEFNAKTSEQMKVCAVVLDNKFNKLWSKRATLSFEYGRMDDYVQFAVDNNGNACAAIPNAEGEDKHSYYLHTFNSKGEMNKGTYPIATSKVGTSIKVKADNKNNFYVAATYQALFKEGTSGMKLYKYSVDSTKATWVKDYNHSKLYKPEGKALDALHLKVSDIKILENGSLYITEELFNNITNDRYENDMFNYGLLFHTFDASGNLENSAFITKASQGWIEMSTPIMLKGNKLYCIYNYTTNGPFSGEPGRDYGFYLVTYDGKEATKQRVEGTDVSGTLVEATPIDNDKLVMVFVRDARTGYVHLAETK